MAFDRKQYNKEYNKQYYQKNQEKLKANTIQWQKDNKEKRKEYNQKNKESINKWDKENKKKKRDSNPLYKLENSIRSRIGAGISKSKTIKNKSTKEIIGLESWDLLREYIEKQWEDGMSWDNHGHGKDNTTWHIDHIKPLSSAQTEDDIYTLNHYTNLRPMWGSDNIRKSNK
jgi:hypothetical protein